MSRDIKFRAWSEKHKEMVSNDDLIFENGDWFAMTSPPDADVRFGEVIDVVELMQYTGLKDKNGVEIYEGDILQIDDPEDDSKCVVVFKDGAFKKQFKYSDESLEKEPHLPKLFFTHFDSLDLELWVVAGKIHEEKS